MPIIKCRYCKEVLTDLINEHHICMAKKVKWRTRRIGSSTCNHVKTDLKVLLRYERMKRKKLLK